MGGITLSAKWDGYTKVSNLELVPLDEYHSPCRKTIPQSIKIVELTVVIWETTHCLIVEVKAIYG